MPAENILFFWLLCQSEQYLNLPGFVLQEISRSPPNQLIVSASSISDKASCPLCSTVSTRLHGRYTRELKALPWGEFGLRLRLTVHRHSCDHANCSRRTFVEQIPEIAPPYARRTAGATNLLRTIAFEINAEATARISIRLHMPVSADTVLPIVRSTDLPEAPPARAMGVDDWAYRKGQVYGTILVDLETHKPIELLPGRSADTLKKWLGAHPDVKLVARDRSKEYKAGIDASRPGIVQVVDRWHLYLNLRQRLEKILAKALAKSKKASSSPASHRQKRFEWVRYLHQRGYSSRTIARALDMPRGTVRAYINAVQLPNWNAGTPRRSKLENYDWYLRKRWQEGCRNASAIWKELREMGYRGEYNSVNRYLHRYRSRQSLSPRQAAWPYMSDPDRLPDHEAQVLRDLIASSESMLKVYNLAQEFVQMLSSREASKLDPWLTAAENSEVVILKNFAVGLRHDFQAVEAALLYPWSNGQAEGQITRLKMIKRQRYGREKFELLRIRILGPP